MAVLGLPLVASTLWGAYLRDLTSFAAGALAATFGAAWLALYDEPPAYLQKWRDGAEGERRTHREIADLGWHAVEDVDTGRGNYDHIVVGAAGVYLLETKNLGGTVEIRDELPWLHRRHDPKHPSKVDVRGQVLGASAALFREIERRCGQREWVNAIVVLWSDFPQQVVETDKVIYLHGSKLREWLGSRPVRLDAERIVSVFGALSAMKVEGDIRAEQREASAVHRAPPLARRARGRRRLVGGSRVAYDGLRGQDHHQAAGDG